MGTGGSNVPPACDKADPTMILCMSFDNSQATDESIQGQVPKLAVLGYKTTTSGMSASFTEGSIIVFPKSGNIWTVSAFHVEAWIYLEPVPQSPANRVIFTSPEQFGLLVDSNGLLTCFMVPDGSITPVAAKSPQSVPTQAWTYVSASFDGVTCSLRIGGQDAGANSLPMNTILKAPVNDFGVGANPMNQVASSLQGEIDLLRVFKTP